MGKHKDLVLEWEEKLRASGFVDIEDRHGRLKPEINLRTNRSRMRDSCQEFYEKCRGFLHVAKFENEFERHVWELFSDGKSVREITRIVGTNRDKVHKTIQRLRESMWGGTWKK